MGGRSMSAGWTGRTWAGLLCAGGRPTVRGGVRRVRRQGRCDRDRSVSGLRDRARRRCGRSSAHPDGARQDGSPAGPDRRSRVRIVPPSARSDRLLPVRVAQRTGSTPAGSDRPLIGPAPVRCAGTRSGRQVRGTQRPGRPLLGRAGRRRGGAAVPGRFRVPATWGDGVATPLRHEAAHAAPMGMILRLLLTRLLPGRLAWVVAAFLFSKAMAARRQQTPVPVRTVGDERIRRTW